MSLRQIAARPATKKTYKIAQTPFYEIISQEIFTKDGFTMANMCHYQCTKPSRGTPMIDLKYQYTPKAPAGA